MGYEAELGQHYKDIHNKLFPSKPKILKPPELKTSEIKPIEAPERLPDPITASKYAIADNAPFTGGDAPTIKQLINWVCAVERLSRAELLTRRRTQRPVWARFLICYLARKFTGSSYPKIGRELGGMDHTSVIHAYQRVERFKVTNPIWREYVAVYESLIVHNFSDRCGQPRLCPSCPFKV